MSRKTVVITGNNVKVPTYLKQMLERNFGHGRYLIVFAQDNSVAESILAQNPVSIILNKSGFDQMVASQAVH